MMRPREMREESVKAIRRSGAAVFLAIAGCASGPDWFVDAAARERLRFISYSGDRLWYIIDTMGSGAALGDYDGDGDADVFLLTGSAITDSFQAEAARHRNALWRNDGQGKFTDVTPESGLGLPGWSHGAAFGDYDGDGDLDLFVTNYAVFDPEREKGRVKWFTDGLTQFPQHFPAQDDVLYRNNGDGTFTNITREAGAQGTGRGLGAVATDYDDDGDLDIFVANDVGYNDLLRNDGGRFTNVALEAGVAADADGRFQAGMGVAAADYDNDGDIDLYVTNYAGELNTLYRNDGGGMFTDVTRRVGLDDVRTFDAVGWGTGIHDFDLDGNLDIFVVNGHILGDTVLWYMRHFAAVKEDDIPQMRKESYRAAAAQERQLFLGRGDGTFEDATDRAGRTFLRKGMGRGAAFGDLDGDGRLDAVVTNKNQPAEVLLNRIPPRGNWLALDLRGRAPNRFAVGARARVHAGGRAFTREVYAGTSYLSGDDGVLHFGLGAAAELERVEVRWPDGRVGTYRGLEVNRRHVIEEDEPRQVPVPAVLAPAPRATSG